MEEAIVSYLFENVTQLLVQEAKLLDGVEDQVKSLQSWLALVKEFLKRTEGHRDHNMVSELVEQIRDAAQDAEDAIDTYVVYSLKKQRRKKIGRFFYSIDHVPELHKVSTTINTIKNRIQEIYDNKEKFGIDLNESNKAVLTATLHRRRSIVEEENVIGFVKEADDLKKQLIGKDTDARNVVSIIGMGGLGKTTLARKVYNDFYIQDYFKCRAWYYVSNEYRFRDLLLGILRDLMHVTEEILVMSDDDLKEKLRNFLSLRRYLIVLDDVWTTQLWDEVSRCLPMNKNGSKILITSRILEVASYASSTTRPFSINLRNEDESWELFSKKVFSGEVCTDKQLERLGRRMTRDCNGLPLAVVVLAGFLAAKERSVRMWSKIVENVSWHLTQDPTRCLDILALSYEYLPHHLKPCFLYLGVFPEDFEISVRQLIRLWMAEGFIPQDDKRSMEDLAEDYLEDLIDRSLVQAAKRRTDGGVKSCRIHDLLRDLCVGIRIKIVNYH